MNQHEAVYEMLWDCKYCGQRKLLGLTHRFCAGCGAPQDPSARYFPPDNEKVPVHAHPYVGADVTCPSCRQPMSRAAKCCTNCGGPLDRGAEVARRADVVVPPPGMLPGTPMGMAAAPPPAKRGGILIGVLGGIAALVVAIVLVVVFWRREGVFEVRSLAWQRSIAIERYEPARKTVWCDQVPAGARELSRHKEQKSTEKVKDGETCATRKKDMGNGTFKEVRECQPKYKDTPVMADRCEIEITEWKLARTLTEKGSAPAEPPKWPVVSLARQGACLGCEREGKHDETYTVGFVDVKSGKEASCDLPENRWATFAKGSKWKGKARVMTSGVDCDALVKQ